MTSSLCHPVQFNRILPLAVYDANVDRDDDGLKAHKHVSPGHLPWANVFILLSAKLLGKIQI